MFFHPKNLKSENNNPWFKPWFNIDCVCYSRYSVFRAYLVGIYNFESNPNPSKRIYNILFSESKMTKRIQLLILIEDAKQRIFFHSHSTSHQQENQLQAKGFSNWGKIMPVARRYSIPQWNEKKSNHIK